MAEETEIDQNPPKLSVQAFAAQIKAKYPAYQDMDDAELAKNIIAKYPVYADQVDFGNDIKKKSQDLSQPFPGLQPNSDGNASLITPIRESLPVSSSTAPTPSADDFSNSLHKGQTNPFSPEATSEQLAERSALIDKYAANPNSNPAIVKALQNSVKPPDEDPGFFTKAKDFAYNNVLLPLYGGSVALVNKLSAGAVDMVSDAGKAGGMNVIPEGMRNFFDEVTEKDKALKPIGNEKQGLGGEIVSGVSGAVGTIAALATGTGEVAAADAIPELSNELLKNVYLKTAYNAVTAPIVKLFAATGAAGAYHDSSEAGNNILQNINSGIEGGIEGGESGLKLEAQMLVGGAFGKSVANGLAEKGLMAGGKAGQALIHSLAIGTVFGGSAAAEDIINNEDPDKVMNDAVAQFVTGAAFGIPEVAHGLAEDADLNKANKNILKTGLMAKSVQDSNNSAIVSNIMGFTDEQIQQINQTPQSPEELYAGSLEVGAKAYDETDPEVKKKLMLQQLSLKNQADIKRGTETIVNDPVSFAHAIITSELPEEDKLHLLDKITTINKNNNPVELEKTDIGKTINSLNTAIQQTQDNIANTPAPEDKAAHYVTLNDQIGQRVAAQNRLFEMNVEQQRLDNEKQGKLSDIEQERRAAHDSLQVISDPDLVAKLSDPERPVVAIDKSNVYSGGTEEEVRKQIDDHYDQRRLDVNNEPVEAAPAAEVTPAPAQEAATAESPTEEKIPEDIKPQPISNKILGDAQIIDYKEDGTISVKMADGTVEEIKRDDRPLVGITTDDVFKFRNENNFPEPTKADESTGDLGSRIQDLAQRIVNKDEEFTDADQKLHTTYPKQVERAVQDLQAPAEVNESLTIPSEGERAEKKQEYRSQLEGELDGLRQGQRTATGMARRTENNEKRPVKSAGDFMKKILSPFTAESVKDAKANLVDIQRRYKENKRQLQEALPRERGANFLVEKLSKAARTGDISQEHADLAINLVRSNPELFKDLAISITHGSERPDAQGWYSAADALVKVLKGSDELTATHEILHHTERFLPEEVRAGILKEWHDQVQKQKKSLLSELKDETDPDRRYKITTALQYLGLAEQRQLETDPANQADMERIMRKYLKEDLGQSFYKLYNPSEWWAVNASEKFREQQNKPEGWVQKAKDWYNGLIKAVKNTLWLNATEKVERGLKSILSGDVLDEMKGTQLSGAQKLFSLEDRPEREPGEPLKDYIARLREFNDRAKAGEDQPPPEPRPTEPTEEAEPPKWELGPETKTEAAKRKLKDYLTRQEVVQRAIERAGGKINDRTDYHTAADLQGAKVAQHVNELYERMIKSPSKETPAFFERLYKDDLNKEDLDKFLRASHVEEYNREVGNRRREAYTGELDRLEGKLKDAQDRKNYSGEHYYKKAIDDLKDQKNAKFPLMDDGAAGMTNAEAAKILDDFKTEGKFDKLKEYGDEFVKEVSNRQLDVQKETGTIDKDTYDMLKKKFENYVPFHVEDFLQPKEGKHLKRNSTGLSSVDNIIRKAKGSVERTAEQRVSPSSYGIVQLEKAYREGEINKTSNILYNLVEQNPNDQVFEIVHPKYSPTYRKDGTVAGFRETTEKNVVKDSIQLYRDGRKTYIHVKDPALRSAIGKLGFAKTYEVLGHIQNFYRLLSTELNPQFWVTNTVKHMAFGMFNLSAEGKADIAGKVIKNSVPAIKAAFDWERGKRDGEWAPFMERYLQAGGKLTGIPPALDMEKLQSIEKAVNEIGQKKNLKQNTKAMLMYISRFGDASGVGPRLAIFRGGVENGMTDMEAAKLSREASINFNKKGEWSGFAGNLYLMFNSHAQAAISLVEKANNPTAQKIFAGTFALGVLSAAMNHAFTKDEDDPIVEYDKQNNFVLKNPFGAGSFKVPVYSELNTPYYMGTKMYEVFSGQAKPGDAGLNVLTNTLRSYSPVAHDDLLQILTPTEPLRSLVQYEENKNTFGSPIYKDASKYGTTQPSSHTHFASTPKEFVKVAQELNSLSGGTGTKSGKLDFSPDAMEWLYNTATGGVGGTIQKTGETGVNLAEHLIAPEGVQLNPVEIRNIPVLKSFYTTGTPINYQAQVFDILEKSGNHEISGEETTDFFNALTGAAVKGKINMQQFKQYKKEFIDNQTLLLWGDQLPDMEKKDIDALKKKRGLIK